jgi:RsiW-degrading membrane proteinase PrsW (M82 family)
MGAAASKGVKPHPLLTVVLLLLVGGILSLFPIALYANAMAMIDGYRASHGQAGTPGTAIVENAVDAKGGQVCKGTIVSDGVQVASAVRIHVPGDCEVGQETEVRLMDGRSSMFTGYDEPQAWAEGANDWAVFVPLVILFGVLSLPLVVLAYMILAKLCKLVFLPKDAPKV